MVFCCLAGQRISFPCSVLELVPFEVRQAATSFIEGSFVSYSILEKEYSLSCKVTGWVGLDSVLRGLGDYFDGDILRRNVRNAERGYEEAQRRAAGAKQAVG